MTPEATRAIRGTVRTTWPSPPTANRDGEYFGYFLAGRAGHYDANEAAQEKWVAPQAEEEIAKAMSDKDKLRRQGSEVKPDSAEVEPKKKDD